MNIVSALAIYFIIWWLTLFCMLPIGVRSQKEAGEAVLGTESGAPVMPRMGFKVVLTTIVASVVFAVYYLITIVWGYGVDDLPRIVPEFN